MKYLWIILLLLPFGLPAQTAPDFPRIDPTAITIVRDAWGVPHIYTQTDAQAAYGLAWAHAEDDFASIQIPLLAVNGKLASVKGKNGAILDVLAFIIDPGRAVEAQWNSAFSPAFRAVLNGYTQGLNAYARAHPDEILRKDAFPVSEKDIIKGYTLALSLMTNVQFDIQRILGNSLVEDQGRGLPRGSNAIALSSRKTADGNTYLAVNSHQPLEGPFSWYEVHIESAEGWRFIGGVFPGGVTPFHGTTPNLGWAHTLNYPDLDDVYKLTMHPSEKNRYKFDGDWLALEERKLKLGVKLWWFLKFPYRRTFYWSKYGTTLKNDQGYYAIRFPANLNIRAAEQWYWMTKAQNFDEFRRALAIQGIPGINTVYADREDNIFFLSNGLFPDRDPAYEWQAVLPSDTSATLWPPDFMPLDSLVQVTNPASGYVFNFNNTPFNATAPEDNPDPANYNPTMGYITRNTARSLRFGELITQYDKLSYDDFLRIKYDQTYPARLRTNNIANLEDLLHLDPARYPDIAAAIAVLQRWNRSTEVHNRQAAVFNLALRYLLDQLEATGRMDYNNTFPEAMLVDAVRFAQKHLRKHFGALEIELGRLQVHQRGDKAYPVGGGFDILAQMVGRKYKDGKYRAWVGESYIQLLRYSRDGVEIESAHCYGASSRPESPHYTDQMEMFLRRERKPMTFDREKVFADAERVYHPE